MKTIRISDEVWDAIATQGKFGETEDTVLRRILKVGIVKPDGSSSVVSSAGVSVESNRPRAWKERRATDRMTQDVANGKLVLEFDSGARAEWKLPPRDDGRAIRKVRDEAVAFVKTNGGTIGQEHAAIRALTSRGYHVTVRRHTAEYA